MNIDLKKSTKYREKEEFNHLLTVLMCMFGEMERLSSDKEETKKEFETRVKKQHKIYKQAKYYLASYIEALLTSSTK